VQAWQHVASEGFVRLREVVYRDADPFVGVNKRAIAYYSVHKRLLLVLSVDLRTLEMSIMLLEVSQSTCGKRSVAIGVMEVWRVQKVKKQDYSLHRRMYERFERLQASFIEHLSRGQFT
jgi:hypothetical protein